VVVTARILMRRARQGDLIHSSLIGRQVHLLAHGIDEVADHGQCGLAGPERDQSAIWW
jgi:hypothetical protein